MRPTTHTRTLPNISGLIVPILTPFDDNNQIDCKNLIRHLEFLSGQGVTRILVNGTTGEFFSLTPNERERLLSLTRRHFKGVLLVQAGSDSLALTMEQVQWAEDSGADAILILPPYYYANPTKEGLIAYFDTLADRINLPFLLYNFPRHTQIDFKPEMLSQIAHFGLKDSSANLNLIPATPRYFVGGDRHIFKMYQSGGCGFVTARANVFPKIFIEMENTAEEKDVKKMEACQAKINRLYETLSVPNEIAVMKGALSVQLPDYPAKVRLPLVPLKAERMQTIQHFVQNFTH